MDDLNAMISSVLSDPEKMKQIQELAAGLGLGGMAEASAPPPPPAQTTAAPDLSSLAAMLGNALGQPQQPSQPQPTSDAGPDMSALASMLSSAMGQQQPAQVQPQNGGMPDLSALSGLLSGAMGTSQQSQNGGSSSGFDVSTLTNMLGGPQPGEAQPSLPIDMNTIMKLGQAMSSMQTNRKNIDFLLSLKPSLNERRSKKVDDAIKVMQLIQFLPLIKETGLFGGLDNLLGGFSGSGGLGGLLNGMGTGSGGLGSLLSGILRL